MQNDKHIVTSLRLKSESIKNKQENFVEIVRLLLIWDFVDLLARD